MGPADFIAARYGDAVDTFLSREEMLRCEDRLRVIWRAMTAVLGVTVHEPLTYEVHSPRALPAFLGLNRPTEPAIVWDAGLGTLFNELSFTMPYPQPPKVVEALVRRVAAVRCLVALQPEQATTQILTAESLLDEHPIDRSYQQRVGAEEQFEIFQIAESQERFALAHELAHYVKAVEPGAFGSFTAEFVEMLRTTDYSAMRHQATTVDDLDPHGIKARLLDNNLDPHAWYLYGSVREDRQGPWPQLEDSVPGALHAFDTADAHESEEIVCDVLAASVVCLTSHLRQAGWTTGMGAACSRLALSNLRAILGIDGWVRDEGTRAAVLDDRTTVREQCLNAFAPLVVPSVLNRHGNGTDTDANDLHLLMQLVEDRFVRENRTAINALTWDPPLPDAKPMTDRQIVLRAGFLNLRPSADHRSANREAVQPLFELGSIDASERVHRSCLDPEFARQIEAALMRHRRGEWDNLPLEDKNLNLHGLYDEFQPPTQQRQRKRGAIWSHLDTDQGHVVIVTTPDRSRTRIEFISEY